MWTLKRTEKVEKVRGMNASLAASNGNALSERAPSPVHITRRQIAFALVLAVLGVIAAIYTVDAITSGQRTFPAEVTTSKVYDLNFANTGLVTDIMVKVGQHVNANQPLALQDATAIKSQVAGDAATVSADKAAVAEAKAPQLTPAQQEQDALQLQQAQTNLTNAQNALATAAATGKVNVASAQQAVTADQSLASGDTTRYDQACPGGPVPPGRQPDPRCTPERRGGLHPLPGSTAAAGKRPGVSGLGPGCRSGGRGAGSGVDQLRPGQRQRRPGRRQPGPESTGSAKRAQQPGRR